MSEADHVSLSLEVSPQEIFFDQTDFVVLVHKIHKKALKHVQFECHPLTIKEKENLYSDQLFAGTISMDKQ